MSKDHPVSAAKISAFGFGFAPGQILSSAVELGIFEAVHKGAHTSEAVAEAIKASERGVRALMDALVGLELLDKVEGKYGCNPLSETYLIPSSPQYMGDIIVHQKELREVWSHLTEVVRTGKPWRDPERMKQGIERLKRLARGLFPQNYQRAKALSKALGMGGRIKGAKVLDVGAGSAAWSIALLEDDPESTAKANDLEPVISVAEEFVKTHGLEGRYEYLPGNIRELDFGGDEYDIAVLGNICHSEGPAHSKDLIAKMGRCIRKGGRIVIVDMIPDDDRTGPARPLIFAINMLVATEDGGTFTKKEYQEWLTAAGFGGIEEMEAEGDFPILVAERL